MKVSKFYPPYQNSGKTRFPESKQQSGVYLIREDGKDVYVGYSGTDLYRTMYRHFQHWNDPTQYRVSYQSRLSKKKYTVRIVYCNPAQARRLEQFLIMRLMPRDNVNSLKPVDLSLKDMNQILKTGWDYEETPADFVPF